MSDGIDFPPGEAANSKDVNVGRFGVEVHIEIVRDQELKFIMMLGRKQSLKGEPVLADYGPDEVFNESADIEWVNKVSNVSNI